MPDMNPEPEERLARAYWHAIDRYERRVQLFESTTDRARSSDPQVALPALSMRTYIRPLVREACDTAAALEQRVFPA